MILPPNARIEEATSKPGSATADRRPATTCVHLGRTRDGQAILEATDTYVYARVPVEVTEGDVPGSIEAATVREHRRWNKREAQQDARLAVPHQPEPLQRATEGVHAADRHGAEVARTLTDVEQQPFPDAGGYAEAHIDAHKVWALGVRVESLTKALAALGDPEVVRLEFQSVPRDLLPSNTLPVVLRAAQGGSEDAVAVMMPVRVYQP